MSGLKHSIILFKWLLIGLILLGNTFLHAQNFINSGLNGNFSSSWNLPYNWQAVPFTDPVCLATSSITATADVTDCVHPSLVFASCNTYGGATCVSALYASVGSNFYHEGIMQTVSGFIPGNTYIIQFHQSVVKQYDALDPSGSWQVFVDNTLAGTTLPTINNTPPASCQVTWEKRAVQFTATLISHTIKFLPLDDDNDQSFSSFNLSGGLRMGIDSILIVTCNEESANVDLGDDTLLCDNNFLLLNAGGENVTYTWQDNSTLPTLTVTHPGMYWVLVTNASCNATDIDTIIITEGDCDIQLELPNVFSPDSDKLNSVFTPINIKGITEMKTSVYNRWGMELFSTTNKLIGWNGNNKEGKPVPDGVYYWIVTYSDNTGNRYSKKGFVTLLRNEK